MAGQIEVKEPERTSPPPPAPPRPEPPPGPARPERRVSILGRQFSPKVMRIQQGDTLRFANGSTLVHTSTSVVPDGGT